MRLGGKLLANAIVVGLRRDRHLSPRPRGTSKFVQILRQVRAPRRQSRIADDLGIASRSDIRQGRMVCAQILHRSRRLGVFVSHPGRGFSRYRLRARDAVTGSR